MSNKTLNGALYLFDSCQGCDRSPQSPQLVVSWRCSTKYGLAIAI
ncbi:hypothetical protein [Coleofasciculus sp. FACHB-1120]|nr:hypothetical protein [Coleofasciculus sp. FACHB-1120]